jgi:hypothetical protein
MKYFFRKLSKRLHWKDRLDAIVNKWVLVPFRHEALVHPNSDINSPEMTLIYHRNHRLLPFLVKRHKWAFSTIMP